MPSSSAEGPGEAGRGSAERMDGATSEPKLEGGSSLASQPNDRDDMDTTSSESDRNGVIEDNSATSENTDNSAIVKSTQQSEAKEPEEEEEKESEDEEEDEQGELKPGLPKFLRRHVKISEYVPVPIPLTGALGMEEFEGLLEVPSMVTPLLKTKPNQFLTVNGAAERELEKVERPTPRKGGDLVADFFRRPAGEFLIGLGLSRAFEVVKRDLVRHKEREMKKASGGTPEMMDEHRRLTEAYQQAKIANAPFAFKTKACKVCDFKTESSLVLDGHLLTPHFTPRRELQCTFCNFVTRDAKAIVYHMEAIHNKLPVMEPPPQVYECPMCPFETNLKVKATGHVRHCQKYFNNSVNQRPFGDFPIPGVTAKPVTIEDIRNHEKFLAMTNSSAPKAKAPQKRTYAALSRNRSLSQPGQHAVAQPLYQLLASAASLNQNSEGGGPRLALIQLAPASNQELQVVRSASEVFPLLNRGPQLALTLARGSAHSTDGSTNQSRAPARPLGPSQVSPGQRTRMLAIVESSGSGAALIKCEICDGSIKDMEQLRTHMQWIHKVKLHSRMLTSRPPLNCQKCQRRFYSDQGLERHLLGAHGLVTSNMQDLANSGKDAGRCTVCGRTYANKLVAHMSHAHKAVLKPAHLSYKCTVCTATFNLYKLFESHVYMVHSNAIKSSSSTADSDERSTSVLAATANTASLFKSTPKPESKEGASGSAKSARKERL